MKTAYQILGVSSSATQEEAKKAHRSLAKQHHPDVDKSPDAHKKMVEINAAWEAVKAGRGAYPPSTAPNKYAGFAQESSPGTNASDWMRRAADFEQAMRDFEELVKRESAKKENQEQAERNRRYQEAVKKADEERRRRQEDEENKRRWEEEESAYWKNASQKTSDFYKGKWDGPTPAADAEKAKKTYSTRFEWWDDSKEAQESLRQEEREREELAKERARTNPFFPKSGTLKDKILWANFHPEEMQEWMYLEMKTGGTDEFSFMNWGMLSSRIHSGLDKIVKTKGINTLSAMRWAARGLDADLAIRKVQVDERFYAERGRR